MDNDDHAVAAVLAEAAGQRLLALRSRTPPERLGAAGDRASQDLLLRRLAALRPADAVLSEQAVDDPRRLAAERVWIIDPLDGTREYAEGRSDWAVHVALWERGELRAGAVAVPGRWLLLTTAKPPPGPPARSIDGPLRFLVSRTRPPEIAGKVAGAIGAELVPMGSAGAKTAAVVLGEADAYIHAGGQYEWDSAAPAAVALAAGLHASRIDGSPLRYNQPDTRLPDILVCRRGLEGMLLAEIARGL